MMKTLVAFYSRTGTTKRVALKLAKLLKADTDEIRDLKDRQGAIGWIFAGRDAMKKARTEIEYKKNPSSYSLVVIGTPIWGWTLVPAIRTYLEDNKENLKKSKLAFFCTMGSSGNDKAFANMRELSRAPKATLALTAKEVIENRYGDKVKQFIKKLK